MSTRTAAEHRAEAERLAAGFAGILDEMKDNLLAGKIPDLAAYQITGMGIALAQVHATLAGPETRNVTIIPSHVVLTAAQNAEIDATLASYKAGLQAQEGAMS